MCLMSKRVNEPSRSTLWRREGSKRSRYFLVDEEVGGDQVENAGREEDEQFVATAHDENESNASDSLDFTRGENLDDSSEPLNDVPNTSPVPGCSRSFGPCATAAAYDDDEDDDGDGDNLSIVSEEHIPHDSDVEDGDPGSPADSDNDFVPFDDMEDNDEEVGEDLTFDDAAMDTVVNFHSIRSVRETVLLELALASRHNFTYESIIASFSAKNKLFNCRYFPQTKKQLWKVLGFKAGASIVKHAYYKHCGFYLGRPQRLAVTVQCQGCKMDVVVSEAKFFYRLSIRKQIQALLSRPDMAEILKYRDTRSKENESGIEDVFDSEIYKKLQATVMTPLDLTYVINIDGCKISKGAKTTLYPLFIRINELPPNLRQKRIILAGVLEDTKEPNLTAFLMSVVKELNKLSDVGISWCPVQGEEEVISKLYPLCFFVDGKARWQILNMSPHSAYYACTVCLFKGVFINGTMRYPSGPHEDIPACEDRTHEGMLADMAEAVAQGQPVRGHRGATPFALLKHFDLVQQGAYDDLHYLYECAAAVNFELLLKVAPRVKENGKELPLATIERVVDGRLAKITTPSNIARKPKDLKIKNRAQWHGTDWRNFVLYYGVPCLSGLIQTSHVNHFSMLSSIAFILSQDSVAIEDLSRADKLIDKYLLLFDQFYGLSCTRLNLHSLKHATKSVLNLGPLRCYSTFNFESWNHKLLVKITSPKGTTLQIATRHLLRIYLELSLFSTNDNLADDVREEIARILGRTLHSNAVHIGDHVYLLGSSTVRVPTRLEAEVLSRENIEVEALRSYKKLMIKGTFYQPKSCVQGLSDNSMIYTRENTFCTIQDIVSLHHNGSDLCGLFVTEHSALPRPFREAHHIVELESNAEGLPYFLHAAMIKCKVVQVSVSNKQFVIPMPNMEEID